MITGAGASCAFGLDGTRLAQMADWSEAVVQKLLDRDGYLGVSGLSGGLSGIQFETQLGHFLNQVASFAQVREIVTLSKHLPSPDQAPWVRTEGSLVAWYENTDQQLGQIVGLIHESLYEQFAEPHWDEPRALDAYRDLFHALDINASSRWVYATTNYDRIGETAIRLVGLKPDWGEVSTPGNTGESEIQVEGLLDGIPRYVPVLHLHGRIGWYRRPDLGTGTATVYSTTATRYQPGFGVPIVMLPDPKKTYEEPVVTTLWSQFTEALRSARRVFVLGHSLNDPAIVRALIENVRSMASVAVCVLADEKDPTQTDQSALEVVEKVREQLDAATMIPIRFGDSGSGREAIARWLEKTAD